jgi:hypothetical protein
MAQIDVYKQQIGYGARNNLFKVSFIAPIAIKNLYAKLNNVVIEDIVNLIIDKINMPHTRNIEALTRINFGNEYFTIAKSKQLGAEAYEEVTFSFRNTEDFKVRDFMSVWINAIQNPRFGTYSGIRLSPQEYKADNFKIQMLDKDLTTVIREVTCYGAFPIELDSFELGFEGGKEEIKSTEVKFSVDYYTTTVDGKVL